MNVSKFLIGLMILGLVLLQGCVETGKGIATDSIADISLEGIVWKTWRVQLTNDHPICDGGSCDQQRYGVEKDPVLIQTLQNYAETGKRVKIYYTSHLIRAPWDYSDDEVIYKVDEIK